MCDFDSCETCNSASTGSYNGMPITRPPMPPNPSTAIDKSMYNPSIHCHRIYRNDLYGNFFCNKCNQYIANLAILIVVLDDLIILIVKINKI